MDRFNVLVTQKTVADEARRILQDAGGELFFMQGTIDERALLAEFARRRIDAVILRGPAPFTPAVLEAAQDLRIIAKYGAGVDSVHLASATAHGVAVMVTSGANADAVAEQALAMMLALARELPRFDRELRRGVWKDVAYLMKGFRGSTVGVVGYGQIGRRTAQLAHACGAKVMIHSRRRVEPPPGMEWEGNLDHLLERADIVTLHCALNETTRGLIGARELARMKPGALLVNTARGSVVDEAALVAALGGGHLGGAGLDTFAVEPPDPANPLFALPNVIVTPHNAASTQDAAAQMGRIAAHNIVSYLRGEVYDPANFINPEVAAAKA
jgi:D-3-phosphoglycerate dehydrogenase